MRVILTTVKSASVSINDKVVGHLGHLGYLLLVGFTHGDDQEIVDKMVHKILSLRVFPDEKNLINLSLQDVNGDILSVSQFTLYASVSGGRRPSFIEAMRPNEAEILYDYFNQQLENQYRPINTGVFGADMVVTSENLGPFTLILDSKELFKI